MAIYGTNTNKMMRKLLIIRALKSILLESNPTLSDVNVFTYIEIAVIAAADIIASENGIHAGSMVSATSGEASTGWMTLLSAKSMVHKTQATIPMK